jgi:hypothetical protein
MNIQNNPEIAAFIERNEPRVMTLRSMVLSSGAVALAAFLALVFGRC